MSVANLRLYELVLENGRSSSPYVWRIRYALAHKGLAFESMPLGFTEISKTFGDRFKTVPVLGHGEAMLAESWDIAEYLDGAFPNTPKLFGSAAEAATVRLTDEWLTVMVMPKLFKMYALDIYNSARPEDRPYFRQSREARIKGQTLEAFTAERVSQLPAAREAFKPLRAQLKRYPFLGGSSPNYADYIALGAFLWVASVATLPLLASDDSLRGWLDRSFDLYGGIGRDPRAKPLFEA